MKIWNELGYRKRMNFLKNFISRLTWDWEINQQRRLYNRVKNWHKFYRLMHGYDPTCVVCVHDPEFPLCYRKMLQEKKHPLWGKSRDNVDKACMRFEIRPDWDNEEGMKILRNRGKNNEQGQTAKKN